MFHRKILAYSRWDIYAFLIFSFFLFSQAFQWKHMPYFMDCYYHLSVMQGFADAGGWVKSAFWEYAPVGRPHLYPPLYHLLGLMLLKCGMGPIAIVRISQVLVYPFFLFSAWFLMRFIGGRRAAFFALFLLSSSFVLDASIVILLPFSLGLIFGMWSFYFFERSDFFKSFLSLVFVFYSHTLMAWFMVAAFLIYGFLAKKNIKPLLLVCFFGILAGLPLLWHQFMHRAYVHAPRLLEFYYSQINLFAIVLALAGFFICLKRGGRSFFLVSLCISMATLIFFYRNRFFSGQGLIPLFFLGAVCLDHIWQSFVGMSRPKRIVLFVLITAIFYLLTPVAELSPLRPGARFAWTSRWPAQRDVIFSDEDVFQRLATFYHPDLVGEAARLIQENSAENDLLYCNFNYGGGMLSVLSHRAMSGAMLPEVAPYADFDPIAAARVIVWFKDVSGAFPPELARVVAKYGLKKSGETEIIYLYLNEKSFGTRRVLPAQAPWLLCFGLIVLGFAGILAPSSKIKVDIS